MWVTGDQMEIWRCTFCGNTALCEEEPGVDSLCNCGTNSGWKRIGTATGDETIPIRTKTPYFSAYYDLILIPSGHIPAPLVNVWQHCRIPVAGQRDEETFTCPWCHTKSYYSGPCSEWCKRQLPKSYFLNKKLSNMRKRIEILFLPILVRIGKAHYIEQWAP